MLGLVLAYAAGVGTVIGTGLLLRPPSARRAARRQIVLDAVRALQPDGRSFTLSEEVAKRTGARAEIGSIFIDLTRLEHDGTVSSRWGQREPWRNNRRSRLYWITADFPELQHEGARP